MWDPVQLCKNPKVPAERQWGEKSRSLEPDSWEVYPFVRQGEEANKATKEPCEVGGDLHNFSLPSERERQDKNESVTRELIKEKKKSKNRCLPLLPPLLIFLIYVTYSHGCYFSPECNSV